MAEERDAMAEMSLPDTVVSVDHTAQVAPDPPRI